MFMHPLLNALFNEGSSTPSKQLTQVRSLFRETTLKEPTILIVLPPADLISSQIETQCLYHDYFLLSHVINVRNMHCNDTFETLNGSQWQVSLTNTSVIPEKGFAANSSKPVNIVNTYMWLPGSAILPYNVMFYIVEVDSLMLNNDAPKRFTWFNSRSTPQADETDTAPPAEKFSTPSGSNAVPSHETIYSPNESSRDSTPAGNARQHRLRNPASELGRTKSQKEQNMAKVDYCLACLQQDVASSKELAERFHRAVTAVRSTLIEAGGLYMDSPETEIAGNDSLSPIVPAIPDTAFTLSSVYEYAEARLGKHLLKKLDSLLQLEWKDRPSFHSLHKELKYLDLTQVDIPNLLSLDISAFERAISDAALILGRLNNSRNSSEMCNVFLAALTRLANPSLGTVSADTLLGLFMLTVLRTSEDTAQHLELDLYFVTNFSFQASDTVAMRASAGRISYTLMVVESVLLQVRMEYERLAKLAAANKALWSAVRSDDREAIKKVAAENTTSICSRRSGKSALFMAAEDQNSSLVDFLIKNFPNIFTRSFVLKDRDLNNRTLLMASVSNEASIKLFIDYLFEEEVPGKRFLDERERRKYLNSKDVNGRTLAFYLQPSSLTERLGTYFDWSTKDNQLDTPILYQAARAPRSLNFFIRFCSNFYDHIDTDGNSLLHLAVCLDDPVLTREMLKIPSCEVDWMNRRGQTPLIISQSQKIESLLLEHGADPWLSKLDSDNSQALREYRLPGVIPYVSKVSTDLVRVFCPSGSENGVVKSMSDFVSLSSTLSSLSPTSWLPPLHYSYPERLNEGKFSSRLAFESTELEMQRLGFWLRQLMAHATFKDLTIVEKFFENNENRVNEKQEGSPGKESKNSLATHSNSDGGQIDEKQTSTHVVENTDLASTESMKSEISSQEKTSRSLFGCENEDSIIAFMNLGRERLAELQQGLQDLIRATVQVHDLHEEDKDMVVKLNSSLRNLGLELSSRYKSIDDGRLTRQKSLGFLVKITVLEELVHYAKDLERRLEKPLETVKTLANARLELSTQRERLRVLAEGKARPTWIGNLEDKRIAEIQSVESAIASNRKNVSQLETDIRASHYFLANELSSFNKAQEEEVLRQVESYSKEQLQKSRNALQRLQFGSAITHR